MFSQRILNGFSGLVTALLAILIFIVGAGAAMAQDANTPIWKDDATGLTWTAKDNGSSVSPNQGNEYCTELKAGGLSGWRTPTIDELEAIYDAKQKKMYKAKGEIELSDPCMLSSSANNSGDIWTFCFNSGSKNLGGGGGCSTTAHTLCVNGPAK